MRRLDKGGDVDRTRQLRFLFDGREYAGFEGDTLASALLANGVRLVGRSFKYHRPRGIYSAGAEEPNALVSIGEGAGEQPNLLATTAELIEDLKAKSQNRWPSLQFDLLASSQLLAPLLGAGFYYKTFMGPGRRAWMAYEHFIRRAAGLGQPPRGDDAVPHETIHEHCDVLVVGSGLAGLEAALVAARSGARVIIAEQDFALGGAALSTRARSAERMVLAERLESVGALTEIAVLTRTQVFGTYDHGVYGLAQGGTTHRLRIVKAERVVIASGAYERGIVFSGNDKPGVMLAASVRTYLNRFGVLCGSRVVLCTNNDSAIEPALDLAAAGAQVTYVDSRSGMAAFDLDRLREAGVDCRLASTVCQARGRGRVSAVDVRCNGSVDKVSCDLVCVSGGWSPVVHLTSQSGAKPVWSNNHNAFLPGPGGPEWDAIGAAAGDYRAVPDSDVQADTCWRTPMMPLWKAEGRGAAFVDLQNDVTLKDVEQASDEGFLSVEHLKRYTTLGMGTDQGKTSNVPGLALLAWKHAKTIPEVGTTTFRPPFSPVSLGTLAGSEVGAHFHMYRRSPLHEVHDEDGAVMTQSGLWERAWFYRENGASVDDAYIREMELVRSKAAICDVSTLGKIEVEGPDSAEFLNRIYTNGWKTLAIGKARWGVMLRDDGYVFDDGTTSRLSECKYFMTTTTANAGAVLARLEFLLETVWPDLKVHVTAVSDQWAAMALAGPRSRKILAKVCGAESVSNAALPFLGLRDVEIAGCDARILRVSFSGELAYEIYAPARRGADVWRALRAAGAGLYGLEALGALRIEKGHVAGNEMDGRTTLDDLGLAHMASSKKPYVGAVLAQREGLSGPRRQQLVGLEAANDAPLSTGAVLAMSVFKGTGDGRITSATWSPSLGRFIALALLRDGRAKYGQTVNVHNPARGLMTTARVRDPHFLDPNGERMRD